MFYDLSSTQPNAYKMADEHIPNVWGSLREAWIFGYLGWKNKFVRGSACSKFYQKGKLASKTLPRPQGQGEKGKR